MCFIMTNQPKGYSFKTQRFKLQNPSLCNRSTNPERQDLQTETWPILAMLIKQKTVKNRPF